MINAIKNNKFVLLDQKYIFSWCGDSGWVSFPHPSVVNYYGHHNIESLQIAQYLIISEYHTPMINIFCKTDVKYMWHVKTKSKNRWFLKKITTIIHWRSVAQPPLHIFSRKLLFSYTVFTPKHSHKRHNTIPVTMP